MGKGGESGAPVNFKGLPPGFDVDQEQEVRCMGWVDG